MNPLAHRTVKGKISPMFAERLAHLAPGERIQAIVLLETPSTCVDGRRRSSEQRKVQLDAVLRAATHALDEIDEILKYHDGQRISLGADALGSVVVETTVEGISALAASDKVRAILEDQPLLPNSP